jgi:hypothetical protein
MPKRTRDGKFCTTGGNVLGIHVEEASQDESQNQDEGSDELTGLIVRDD